MDQILAQVVEEVLTSFYSLLNINLLSCITLNHEEWSSNLFVFINCEKYSCAKVFQFISSAWCGENEAYEPFFLSRRKGHLQSLSLHKERTAKEIFATIFAMILQFYYQGTRGSRSRRILPIILWWWVCSRPGFNNYIIGNYHHYYVRLVLYNWINESNLTYLQIRSIFRPKGFSQPAVGNF